MFCKKCGKQIQDNAKFCGACGTPVQTIPASKTTPARKSVPVQKEKKPIPVKKLLAGAAALAAVVLVVALFSTLFGKKTVWLVTKEVWREGSIKDVIEYTYDKQGRLLEYKDDLGEISYTYEGSRIVEAEWDRDPYLEYIYGKKGNLEAVEGDGFEAEVTCDKKGRILEMEFEGDRELSIEYSYHDNGCIQEVELNQGDYKFIWTYSPNGKILERVVYYSGEKYSTDIYEYDSEDRLLEHTTEKYMSGFSVTELREYDKKGNWVGFSLSYGGDEVIECEVTGDSTTREAIVTWTMVDYLEEGDPYIKETYDQYGNCVERITYGDDTIRLTWEYEKRKISRNDTVFDVSVDPRYCLFLGG